MSDSEKNELKKNDKTTMTIFQNITDHTHRNICDVSIVSINTIVSMRVLIIIAHANDQFSTSHKIAKLAEEALLEDDNEVRVVDLLKVGFDKVASKKDFTHIESSDYFDYETSHSQYNDNLVDEIVTQQENVKWCTHMIVVGPMWFYRYPAIFYAYFERVFCLNFAYTRASFGVSAPLRGRKVMCVVTLGGLESTYLPTGPMTTVEGILYHVTRGSFGYCGFTCLRSQAFYGCSRGACACDSPDVAAKWKRAVRNLDRRPQIPLGDGETAVGEGAQNEGQACCGLRDLTLDEAISA